MPSPSSISSPIRAAIIASPEYPFQPIDAAVKLDQNESEDFPAHLKEIALSRLKGLPWNRYPDLHSDGLREAIGAYEQWPASGIVVTTGSNVLIPLLMQLAGLGKRVVTLKPNFAPYPLNARMQEIDLTEVALRADMSLDKDAVIAALRNHPSGQTGVLCLPQPHAPSGSLASPEDVREIVQASTDWLTVIDEAYYQFSTADAKPLAREYQHVVLLRTFSKAWGLAGLRLGYALTTEEIARQLQKLVPPFATSLMQTVAAQVALTHADYVKERVQHVINERERVFRILQNRTDWHVYPSQANFLLIRTPDAAQAHAQLLSHGVLIRRQDSLFGLKGCIRVSIGTREENDAFMRAAGLRTYIH